MRILKTIIFFVILVLAFTASARIFYSYAEVIKTQGQSPMGTVPVLQATVEDLSSDKYFPKVKEVLTNAKSSIYMMMYFVNFNEKLKNSSVNQLVDELINANKRGVKVKVILDQNINYNNLGKGSGTWEREAKNDPLFLYLKKNGIEVYYDNVFIITHSKVIIIDEEIVILGSANWTMSSLKRNWEGSCLIRSKELAKEFLKDFASISIDYEASILDEERKPPVLLNQYLLRTPSLGPRMLTNNDGGAFGVYVLLLRNFDGNAEGKIEIDYKVFSHELGYDEKLSYVSARDKIMRSLMRLEKEYKLIFRIQRPAKGPCVILLGYPNKSPYVLSREEYFSIPDEYWKYGWNKKFSLRESYCYFIARFKTSGVKGHVWRDHIIGLSKDFNVSRSTIGRGMQSLRTLNILEIDYSPYLPEEDFKRREASLFKLLRLYSPEILEKDKQRVRELYGKKRFEEAERYAKIVFKGNDTQVIEDIIKKIDEYGAKQVREAFKTVSVKSTANPKRSYRYVVGILQTKAEEAEID
ncbi:MAG: phospholipase D-like domain-containing protein [Candidatus Omnitrophota bacterium]